MHREPVPPVDPVAQLILQNDPKVQENDLLWIGLIRGYNLGIAHALVSHYFEHTPSDWRARLFGTWPAESSTPTKQ
jgi:hypothetical protein